MPQTGICTDVTCTKELTELYECHCCSWLICLKHLLEHVEISKRDRNHQLNILRNDLVSTSYALQSIVDKKLHDIECEKQLIEQAKIIIDKNGHTLEEIQSIVEQINQAILANRTEETIVKVEPSLSDVKDCSCENQICQITNTDKSNSYSSSLSNNILQQTKSPVYHSARRLSDLSVTSLTRKNLDLSTKISNSFDISNINNENIDPSKNATAADNNSNHEEYDDQENSICPDVMNGFCPLTFDGAFGITKANHSIHLCVIGTTVRRGLHFHLIHKHKLKKDHITRICQAVKDNKDPHTTKLVNENEEIIDQKLYLPCPFSNTMISLIGRCPLYSRNIPCKHQNITNFNIVLHLRKHHGITANMTAKIIKAHRKNLKNMDHSH